MVKSKQKEFCTYIALIANIFLFIIKIIAGIFSGSIALISDALSSLTDIISSLAIIISIKISIKKADTSHPFGHSRAEPIAGMIVAIIAALLGLEIIKESFLGFFKTVMLNLNIFVYVVIIITIVLKIGLYFYFKYVSKKHNSPVIKALSVDSINDVLVSSFVLIGIIMYNYNILFIDNIVGILIGLWIIKSGFEIGIENIDFLMGKRPSEEIISKIKKSALSIKGVKGVNDIFAHYVGPYVHVEVHIEVDKKLQVISAHTIGKKAQAKIEKLNIIDKVFIHIDPFAKK